MKLELFFQPFWLYCIIDFVFRENVDHLEIEAMKTVGHRNQR